VIVKRTPQALEAIVDDDDGAEDDAPYE